MEIELGRSISILIHTKRYILYEYIYETAFKRRH